MKRLNLYYIQEDCELKEKYKMDLEEHLGAVVKSIDFENYPVIRIIYYR